MRASKSPKRLQQRSVSQTSAEVPRGQPEIRIGRLFVVCARGRACSCACCSLARVGVGGVAEPSAAELSAPRGAARAHAHTCVCAHTHVYACVCVFCAGRCGVGRVQISQCRFLSRFRSDFLLPFRPGTERPGDGSPRRESWRRNPQPGLRSTMHSRESEANLCICARVNAPGKRTSDLSSSAGGTSWFHSGAEPELGHSSFLLLAEEHSSSNPQPPFCSCFLLTLTVSLPRFRAQEFHGEQQRRGAKHQPSDSRQGLLGLDGFRPPQRRGV